MACDAIQRMAERAGEQRDRRLVVRRHVERCGTPRSSRTAASLTCQFAHAVKTHDSTHRADYLRVPPSA